MEDSKTYYACCDASSLDRKCANSALSLMNRFGHCQSYNQVLEVETAMANEVIMLDSVLPSNIMPSANKVCHCVWDNFDMNEETSSGSGTTHTTHGIVIQEVYKDFASVDVMNTSIPKMRERTFKYFPKLTNLYFKPSKQQEPKVINTPSIQICTET